MARGSDKEAAGGGGEGNDDHSDPEMSGSGHKKIFFRPFGCQFHLKITRGGGTPLQQPNGDVPLDGVAFSRLE